MDITFLSKVPFFSNIPYDTLQNILSLLIYEERTYQKGEFLLDMGEVPRAAGLVVSGKVHILREDFWGNRTLMTEIESGFFFAETYALLQIPSEMRVQAVQDSHIIYIQLQQLLTTKEPTLLILSQRLIQSFATRNLTLTKKISHITCRTTREKLFSYLSSQAQVQGTEIFSIPFDRQQLADYLGVERSAMCTELSKLKKDGWIDYHKNQFRLHKKRL